MPILKGDSEISLRVIDWFVTNYSKKNNDYKSITFIKKRRIKINKKI